MKPATCATSSTFPEGGGDVATHFQELVDACRAEATAAMAKEDGAIDALRRISKVKKLDDDDCEHLRSVLRVHGSLERTQTDAPRLLAKELEARAMPLMRLLLSYIALHHSHVAYIHAIAAVMYVATRCSDGCRCFIDEGGVGVLIGRYAARREAPILRTMHMLARWHIDIAERVVLHPDVDVVPSHGA